MQESMIQLRGSILIQEQKDRQGIQVGITMIQVVQHTGGEQRPMIPNRSHRDHHSIQLRQALSKGIFTQAVGIILTPKDRVQLTLQLSSKCQDL